MKDRNAEHHIKKDMQKDMQQVVNTCISLQQAGKTPSVGMIKAKLLSPLPIPIIIRGLSYWKEHKATLTSPLTTSITQTSTEQASSTDLHSRVSQLEKEVSELRAALTALQHKP